MLGRGGYLVGEVANLIHEVTNVGRTLHTDTIFLFLNLAWRVQNIPTDGPKS